MFLIVIQLQGEVKREGLAEGGVGGAGDGGEAQRAEFRASRAFSPSSLPHLIPPSFSFLSSQASFVHPSAALSSEAPTWRIAMATGCARDSGDELRA